MKSVINGSYKAIVGARVETKSFGSTTLYSTVLLLVKSEEYWNLCEVWNCNRILKVFLIIHEE
jgi:hypothetical protein